jgi:hypothetical protein
MQRAPWHSRRPASTITCLHRSRRLKLLLLATAVILAACATQSPSGEPTTRTATPATSPSASPSPAWPTSHVLVRSWTCLMCIYSMGTMVFDDGLVLTDGRDDGAIRARHLSPEGLAWVQARLAESPLAAGSASYRAVPAPGAPPDLHEHTPHRFALERDGSVIRVESDVVAELTGDLKAWTIPDEMLRLEQLSKDLANVDAWVPADLWSDTWAPYRPERFLLVIDPQRDTPPEDIPRAPDADEVPWPLAGGIDRVGTTRPSGDPLGERCAVVGGPWAERLAAAEAAVGVVRSLDEPYVSNVYRWRRGNGALVVATRWLLPNEPADCRVADTDW